MDLAQGSTTFSEALEMPLSVARAYLGHEFYSQGAKNEEARQKLVVAILDRINSVTAAIYKLPRALGGRR